MAPFWGVGILVKARANSPMTTPSAKVPSSVRTGSSGGTRALVGTPWVAVVVAKKPWPRQ